MIMFPTSPRMADAARVLGGSELPLVALAAGLGAADLLYPLQVDEDLVVAAMLHPLGPAAAEPFGPAAVEVVAELEQVGLVAPALDPADRRPWFHDRRDELARLTRLVADHRPSAVVALAVATVDARRPDTAVRPGSLWLAHQRHRALSPSSLLPRRLVDELGRHVLHHLAVTEQPDADVDPVSPGHHQYDDG